jgi:hypothetical protein
MNHLPNRYKWQNSRYFGQNIDYQIGISAKAINQANKLLSYRSPNDSRLIERLIGILADFLNIHILILLRSNNMIVILLLMHPFIYCTIQQYYSRLCAKINTIQRARRVAAPNLPSHFKIILNEGTRRVSICSHGSCKKFLYSCQIVPILSWCELICSPATIDSNLFF